MEEKLTNFIGSLRDDPLGYVKTAYEWGKGELTDSSGPREWQADILNDIGNHLRNPETRFTPLLIAIASGHGIGKSSLISMICNWGLSTCVDTKIVVTANTETQLRTKTWPEICKWIRGCINSHWFKTTATSVYAVSDEHERTWRADAIAWSENNTEAFAGLHNKGRRIILVFDEGSSISDKVWEVAEGALTDSNTEIIWLAFGNPTRNTGRFRECFGKFKHRWKHKQIDSRTVEGTNKAQIEQWIEDYGEDSDFVRVRVKGAFPRAGTMQFIDSEMVGAARRRLPSSTLYDPLVMGVDVARFGDDQTVIVLRRGRDAVSIPWVRLRGADTMTVAAKVVELSNIYKPDAIFVDGGGVGGGVVDRLRMLKQPVIEVQFGGSPDSAQMKSEGDVLYANKRAEMWGMMREWLRGGSIPDRAELEDELCGVEYGYTIRAGKDAIILEKKADMKKRGLSSPDEADALCFVAGTLIATPNGNIPIENLSVGDEVVTPFGITKICRTWLSNTDKLTTVEFSNGKILSGKGEHKIFTWNTGQTKLDALSLTDEISTIDDNIWKILKLFITKDSNIQFRPLVDIIRAERNVTADAFYIAIFGSIIMDLYLKGITYITRMATGVIMIFPTWNAFTQVSIAVSTQKNLSEKAFSSHQQNTHSKEPLNGIIHQKVLNGINKTPENTGKMLKLKPSNVLFVKKIMKPIWGILNIAVVPALKKLGLEGISQKLENVNIVTKNLLQTAIEPQNVALGNVPTTSVEKKVSLLGLRKNVLNVVNYLNQLLIGHRRSIVPVSVVTKEANQTATYNITLEKHNAYYANDILVYNCLTFAYSVQSSLHMPDHKSVTHQFNYDPLSLEYVSKDIR